MTLSTPRLVGLVIALAIVALVGVNLVQAVQPAVEHERSAARDEGCMPLVPTATNPKLGKFPVMAPDIQAQDYTGKMVPLSAYRGKVVLQGDLRALRTSSPDRYLRVDVAVEEGWVDPAVAVVTDQSAAGSRLRLHPGADPGAVLDVIRAHRPVTDFGVETPSLSELFLDATGHRVEP